VIGEGSGVGASWSRRNRGAEVSHGRNEDDDDDDDDDDALKGEVESSCFSM
jgi:hypothetical protein